MGRAVAVLALASLLLVACDSDNPGDPAQSDDAASSAAAVPSRCADELSMSADTGQPELAGTDDGITTHALLFVDNEGATARREVKIVWRITGAGPPHFKAVGPSGNEDVDALRWGPEAHGGSNWHRPGDEWGTGFRFDSPGCWDVIVTRGTGESTVQIAVRPRQAL